MPKISKEEKQWRAECDARTLAEYQEILSDKSRLRMAKTQAAKQAKELSAKVNNLKKVSKTKGGK